MFDFLRKKNKTTVTSVNVKLQGYTHKLPGMESSKGKIELEIPFRNKTHSDMLTEAGVFKAAKGKPLSIQSIEVLDPFKLASVEPKPPLVVKADETIKFKIIVDAPAHNYTGPLSINFNSVGEEVIHIELTKTSLVWNGAKKEIESSSRMLNLQKGGILVEKVQLFKAMRYGDMAKSIEVSFPFKLVSTDPKLPAKIDDPNSYIMALYLQAPQHNYSGELEIKIS